MKQKSVSMLLLAMSLVLLSGMSVASAQDVITYTGDAYESKCNVCLEATVLDDITEDPNSGLTVRFKIKPKGGNWGGSTVGTATTGPLGVATLCIGAKAPGEYRVRAIIVGSGGVRVTTDLNIYAARATGGGQIVQEEGAKRKNWYKISFGMGAYDLGGDGLKLDSCEVTFHNVSNNDIDKWKFVGDELTGMVFSPDGTGAELIISGELEDKKEDPQGAASITIRLQDLGEPAWLDNIRLILTGVESYDSSDSGDFPSDTANRTWTAAGNFQVEELDCP
ncbi:MAG: hypothetical protein FVQ79_13510 [Planctomycetes bacterium]|nr:hypothetical protein [Planctomycetota bacterium]